MNDPWTAEDVVFVTLRTSPWQCILGWCVVCSVAALGLGFGLGYLTAPAHETPSVVYRHPKFSPIEAVPSEVRTSADEEGLAGVETDRATSLHAPIQQAAPAARLRAPGVGIPVLDAPVTYQ